MIDKPVFVYGARGHGRVVGDLLLANGIPRIGYIDDNASLIGIRVLGYPVLGTGEWLRQEAGTGSLAVALGVADNRTRKRLADRCRLWNIELITAVHPSATVSPSARLDVGTIVLAGAIVNPEAAVGTCSIINSGAVIEHEVQIGEYAHVAPNAVMGGAARLGDLAKVGMGAVILQNISVGSGSLIGAGAVVTRDIPEGVVAVGVPARVKCRAAVQLY